MKVFLKKDRYCNFLYDRQGNASVEITSKNLRMLLLTIHTKSICPIFFFFFFIYFQEHFENLIHIHVFWNENKLMQIGFNW